MGNPDVSIQLACPCDRPLDLIYHEDWDGQPKWILGHIDSMCGPLIHGSTIGGVVSEFVRLKREAR